SCWAHSRAQSVNKIRVFIIKHLIRLTRRVHMNAKTKAPPAPLPALRHSSATSTLPDARAKQILKEAVDAVVNSFAKHTQGYGRGKSL
ncbi:LIX1-like protein, partial [Homalodisca vitripennis]